MKQLIQITSGRGPAECCWVVAQVLKYLLEEAGNKGLFCQILHREKGNENGTLKTAVISLEGDELATFLKDWVGTIQWIGQSKFRKLHKRKNWYVGINKLDDQSPIFEFNDRDIRYEFTRSGGPGGQHVNKVSTAVRAIHLPSKETVFVSDGRSQLQNKKEARRRLMKRVEEKRVQETKENIKISWENHDELERGNPVRVFRGSDFKPNHQNKKFKSKRKSMKQDLLNRFDD